MKIKVLKNKKFHIPTERIKEADENAEKQQKLRQRINNMTDEEYEEYVRQELAGIDKEIENGEYVSEEEFWKQFNDHIMLLQMEIKNYDTWKEIIKNKRKENIIRYIS